MTIHDRSIADRLSHVYWLGGGSGGGKSTVARRLAETHGLRLYGTDEAMADHARRCGPGDAPYLQAFMAMDMDERWVRRSPEVMLDEFHWFRGEAFDLIVEDLLGLPADRRVLVEGFRLLPGLVEPMLADRRRAAWLIPTPAFRLAAFTRRGGLMEIAGRTSDPEHALRNLLLRDAMFTSRVEKEVARRGLCALAVDGAMTIEDLSARVAERFDL